MVLIFSNENIYTEVKPYIYICVCVCCDVKVIEDEHLEQVRDYLSLYM